MTVDTREAHPNEAFAGRTVLHIPAKEYASKTMYFLRFIPEVHIQEIILPATNQHASTIIPNFKAISYPECLLWIALWIIMTVIRLDNHAAYWQRGAMAGILAINFSKYMSMERFDTITKMHIFCRPDATRLVAGFTGHECMVLLKRPVEIRKIPFINFVLLCLLTTIISLKPLLLENTFAWMKACVNGLVKTCLFSRKCLENRILSARSIKLLQTVLHAASFESTSLATLFHKSLMINTA